MGFHIQGRITSVLDELSNAEKKIGQYILEHPSDVIMMTASELAKKSGTSSATVIRFCKSIDIPSFTELKVHLSPEVDQPRFVGYSDIEQDESLTILKNKLLGNSYQSMLDTVEQLNHELVEQFVEELIKAPILYVYGVGASSLVAENIQQKWSRLGKTVIFIRDLHVFIPVIVSETSPAIFWGISNSGETSEVNFLMELATNQGMKTASLSQFGSNTLSTMSQIPLYTVKNNEAKLRSAATSSLHAQFMIVDIIFFLYASKNYQENYTTIKKTRNYIQDYNDLCK